jgi:phasin
LLRCTINGVTQRTWKILPSADVGGFTQGATMAQAPFGKSKKPAVLAAVAKPAVIVDQAKVQAEALETTAINTVEQTLAHADALAPVSPAVIREMADHALNHARDNYAKFKSATEQASSQFEQSYSNASKGVADCMLKLVEIARARSNVAFDYATQVATIRSVAEIVEISGAHARKQFDLLQEQGREFNALAQKFATQAAEPARESLRRSARDAA